MDALPPAAAVWLIGNQTSVFYGPPLSAPPVSTGGSTMMGDDLSSLMRGGALSSLAGTMAFAPHSTGGMTVGPFGTVPASPEASYAASADPSRSYGRADAARQRPRLSDQEKKVLREKARAIGGASDLDGDGKVGCRERDRAEQIRDEFVKKQADTKALASGAHALGYRPSDLR